MSRVSQIAVLEEFSLCLIIADKSLIAYHLDVIVPVSSFPAPQHDSARRAPQKLSGTRDVSFFATARMKDRTLVFYKKREGLHSTFKVLEPVFQKSSEKKSRLLERNLVQELPNSSENLMNSIFPLNVSRSTSSTATLRYPLKRDSSL